jgi:hypothetical protein
LFPSVGAYFSFPTTARHVFFGATSFHQLAILSNCHLINFPFH